MPDGDTEGARESPKSVRSVPTHRSDRSGAPGRLYGLQGPSAPTPGDPDPKPVADKRAPRPSACNPQPRSVPVPRIVRRLLARQRRVTSGPAGAALADRTAPATPANTETAPRTSTTSPPLAKLSTSNPDPVTRNSADIPSRAPACESARVDSTRTKGYHRGGWVGWGERDRGEARGGRGREFEGVKWRGWDERERG